MTLALFTRTILSQPPTPSPSLYPLLQLGEEEDGDKKKRIQLLEDSIRSQEEMVSNCYKINYTPIYFPGDGTTGEA